VRKPPSGDNKGERPFLLVPDLKTSRLLRKGTDGAGGTTRGKKNKRSSSRPLAEVKEERPGALAMAKGHFEEKTGTESRKIGKKKTKKERR